MRKLKIILIFFFSNLSPYIYFVILTIICKISKDSIPVTVLKSLLLLIKLVNLGKVSSLFTYTAKSKNYWAIEVVAFFTSVNGSFWATFAWRFYGFSSTKFYSECCITQFYLSFVFFFTFHFFLSQSSQLVLSDFCYCVSFSIRTWFDISFICFAPRLGKLNDGSAIFFRSPFLDWAPTPKITQKELNN